MHIAQYHTDWIRRAGGHADTLMWVIGKEENITSKPEHIVTFLRVCMTYRRVLDCMIGFIETLYT
jgi:hypothetical protein